jgi:hypothetical protein
MADTNKTEYWTNDDGRDIPTRDAEPGDDFSVTVTRDEAKKQKKFAGNVYWCIVAQQAAQHVGIKSEDQAREFGHAVLTTVAFVAQPDGSGDPDSRVRLRYHHDGRDITKAFDNGKKVDSVMVHFRAPTPSVTREAVRQSQADFRERRRLGMVTPTGAKYQPSRSGERFTTHEGQ